MATIIEQINTAIGDRIIAKIGPAYKELDYILDVAKNKFSKNNKRFGVRPLTAESIDTITNTYTADQPFEIILTHGFINQSNDKDQRAKVFLLTDRIDVLLKDIIKSKVGLNNIILKMNEFSILEPEFLEEDKVVIIRLQITVRYRQAV